MISEKITLSNPQGFHMRPAGLFANAMGKYKSSITIRHNNSDVDGKSIMNIIAACIKCGNEVEIICDGPDEKEALAEAVNLIKSGLGE